MNILVYIRNLFKGRDNRIIQLSLFALCGLMAISFNGITAAYTGGSIYAIFTTPPINEAILYTILGIMLFIFFTGYSYKFTNSLFHSNNEVELPAVSLNCFTAFLRVFPVMFVWGIYLGILALIGLCSFNINSIWMKLFWFFMLILLPFISIMPIKFSYNFKYTKDTFNPLTLTKVIKNTFVSVMIFVIQFVLTAAVVSFLAGLILKFGMNAQNRTAQLIIVLSGFCISTYAEQILNFAYYQGMVEIIKKKGI